MYSYISLSLSTSCGIRMLPCRNIGTGLPMNFCVEIVKTRAGGIKPEKKLKANGNTTEQHHLSIDKCCMQIKFEIINCHLYFDNFNISPFSLFSLLSLTLFPFLFFIHFSFIFHCFSRLSTSRRSIYIAYFACLSFFIYARACINLQSYRDFLLVSAYTRTPHRQTITLVHSNARLHH